VLARQFDGLTAGGGQSAGRRADPDFPLPPPCGTTSDGLLRVARDRLVTGAIVFEFRAGTEGTGWSARASISATLSIELVNGALVPRVRPRPAEIDLDIDTWVEVLGAIFAAPLLIAAEAAVADAERIFKSSLTRPSARR
jgi:hypothetical protein